jgi:hypothetical protein
MFELMIRSKCSYMQSLVPFKPLHYKILMYQLVYLHKLKFVFLPEFILCFMDKFLITNVHDATPTKPQK